MRIISTFGIVALMACRDTGKPVIGTVPTIDSISISPSENITTSTELLCVATASSAINEALTISYQWTDTQSNVLAQTAELVLSPDIVQPTSEITCTATVTDGRNNVSDETSIVVGNTEPTVSNVSITPQEILVDSLLECTFDAEDVDGEELTASYSWTQNGTEVGTDSSLQLDAETFADNDIIVCTVTVEDGYDGTASGSSEAVIGNTMPMIGSTTITPDPAYSYDTLTCTANDVIDLELDEVTISYEWSIDEEIQTETSNMLSGPFHVGARITCKTTPNDGKIDGNTSQTHTTINNTAPVVDSVSITPAIVYADTLLTCEAAASDVDNEETTLSYEWTAQNGIVLGSDASVQLSPSIVSVLDVLTCTATITDPHGDTDSDIASITIVNSEPVVTTAAEITGVPTTTSTLFCSAVFDDVDDGTLPVSYTWTNQDGTQLGTADSYTILASETETGDVLTCTASGADAAGVAIESAASITVENTAPVIASVSLDNTSPNSQDSLTCTVDSASDIDEDTVTYTYTWTVDGQLQAETTNGFAPPLPVGSLISCAVTPNDGKMDGDTATADATVQNTAPTVTSVSIDNGPFYTSDTLTATAVLEDDDGEQTLTANYEWHVVDSSAGNADLMLQSGALDTLDGAQFFDKGDSVYVIVTPNDGVEDGASLTSVPVSISNSEPVGITASVTSSNMFYNDSTLTCAATASDIDPEDSNLTYTYAWSTGDTGADLVLDGAMMPGVDVTCTATATDGSGAAISTDAAGTLINRAPTVDSVTLPQDITAETTSVLCDATGSDPDGETPTLTYGWTVDGVAHSETTNTLTNTFVYGSTVECTVTSADAMETGSSMSATATVLNTAPVVDSITMPSGDIMTDGSITAVVAMSDVDSAHQSTLTANYEWFVSGSSVQSGSDDTLDGSFFQKGNDVYVVVTASDGVDDSDSVTSSSVIIANSSPTNLQVSIASTDSFHNDSTLTCSATADDLDVHDGVDTLTYDYIWSTGATGSTLDLAGSVMPETDITCSVTVSDGTDSIGANAVETIVNRLPTIDSISLPQDATAATASIFCDVSASDLDGETPTISYAWSVDGNRDDETTDTLTRTFLYAEVVTCEATPVDAVDSGAVQTATTTILNTPPVVSSVVLGPDPAYTDSSFSVTSSRTDIDTAQSGTMTTSYQWYADGQPVGSDTSTLSNNTINEFFAKGHDVYVVLTPNDGVTDGTPVQSNTVTVLNTVPTTPTVSISADNDPAEAGVDDLTCTIDTEAADGDGDALTYNFTWYDQDGNWAAEELATTALSHVYPGADTNVGTWTCEVVANDGDADSDMATAVYVVEPSCDGSATFTTQTLASGREVQGGIIADVDGDGYEDALFNEQLDNRLQIYWGDGSGEFSTSNKTQLSIGRSGGPGAVGDFDNDGDNDIVWGLQDSSTMKRIFNNGNRSFSIQSSSESQGPRNMELIDVNGDGNLDVYIYKRFGSCVARKLGNGDGTFGSTSCVTSGRAAFDVSDIDGDGTAEMVFTSSGVLHLAQLNSNGLIQSSSSMNIPTSGWPKFYDINLDGFDDLFVYYDGEIIQMINDGSGNFGECSLISGLSRSFTDVGDFNQDGLMDYIYFTTCGYCNSTNYFVIQD